METMTWSCSYSVSTGEGLLHACPATSARDSLVRSFYVREVLFGSYI